MSRRSLSLPSKLFVTFGILLLGSLVLILSFLNFIYNAQLDEEVYLRIHNGGKTAVHDLQSRLDNLQIAVETVSLNTPATMTPEITHEIQAFCQEQSINYLLISCKHFTIC